MMKDYAVYLDLDGVMADYDAGIRSFGFTPDPALNRSSHLLPGSGSALKREMYEAVQGTTFYADLPLLPGAVDLYNLVRPATPIILTAAPKFGATEDDYFLNPHWLGAAFHKRNWVETVLRPKAKEARTKGLNLLDLYLNYPERMRIADERFICTTSARKHEFIGRKHSDHQILIDDRPDNINRWNEAGGIGILHVTFEQTRDDLKARGLI